MKSNTSRKRFSLIELIILIIIIIILFALLIPMVFKSRAVAKTVSCSGNLKQCVNAMQVYAANNDNTLCTYGNKYAGWFAQDGIPATLGFKIAKAGRAPITERPVTLCPDIWINSPNRNAAQGYGAAWFIPRADYAETGCEEVVNFPTNPGQMVFLSKVPKLADYVLLADSAYTNSEGADIVPGVQCILFARQRLGGTSHFPRAISLRHNGEANVGYADGHLGTTADRVGMLMKSKIGAYVDATGSNKISTQ